MIDAKNVAIFMSDSVRWDSLPQEVSDLGLSVRTVASSLFTPTAHASMLTGKYLHNHGVRGFFDELPEGTQTILDSFPNRGLSSVKGHFDDPIQGQFFNETIYNTLLGDYEQTPLEELEEPFAWFMRDPGGHAPYGGWDKSMSVSESVPEFYERCAGDSTLMRETYEEGLADSVERFHEYVLEPLESRGILEDTLVVFLSDHGELLGEYGHAGQSFPACPELVYVPTVFIHPDLDAGTSNRLFRHVDLPSTIAALTGVEEPADVDGVNLFGDTAVEHGFSLYSREFPSIRGTFSYTTLSLWDDSGGHVLNTSSVWSKIKLTGGYLTKIPAGKHLRRTRSPLGFKLLLESRRTWGDPGLDRQWSEQQLEALEFDSTGAVQSGLDEDARENLEDLGYL